MPEQTEQQQLQTLQKWADGKATLKDVRGYSDEELFSIARTGYYFFCSCCCNANTKFNTSATAS